MPVEATRQPFGGSASRPASSGGKAARRRAWDVWAFPLMDSIVRGFGHHEGVLSRFDRSVLIALALLTLGVGCRGPRYEKPVRPTPQVETRPVRPLARLGYTIQAGAFAVAENASRLSEKLQAAGLEATYFRAKDGLHKVRFGDFPSKEVARRRAEALKAEGLIEVYYIVQPEAAPSPTDPKESDALRRGLAETARSFLGVPYLWGGTDAETGFDCSGLTMTVYRLHGMRLPRSSREQYGVGSPVERSELRPGDLVFFDTSGRGRVSHVGVYVGGGRFVHAPSKGKHIEEESLSDSYYAARYLGARKYL
jgi:cell wall-associated NlpC family hydrolase